MKLRLVPVLAHAQLSDLHVKLVDVVLDLIEDSIYGFRELHLFANAKALTVISLVLLQMEDSA